MHSIDVVLHSCISR